MPSPFEEALKQSAHFADVMNTHRTATAEVIAAFIRPLVEDDLMSIETVTVILKALERGTNRPSVDGERRHAVSVIREALQRSS